VSNSIAYIG
jgi:hypothetical protein